MTTHALPPARPAGMGGAAAAEWTKLWTVRSTWWVLAAVIAFIVGLTVLASAAAPDGQLPANDAPLGGVGLAQLPIAVLATLAITAEHSTGSIASSLQWVPNRLRFLTSKSLVVLAVAFVLGFLVYLPAVIAAAALQGGEALEAAAVGRGALTSGGLLAATGGICLGLGTLLRSTAGTIVTFIALALVLPGLLSAIPVEFVQTIASYLPGTAITAIFGNEALYSSTVGWIVLAAWAAGALLLGATRLLRSDA